MRCFRGAKGDTAAPGTELPRRLDRLGDYLKYDDLFRYGMTPQFVSRFESIVVLNDLAETDLARIFVEPEASVFRTSREYFGRFGIDLQITPKVAMTLVSDTTALSVVRVASSVVTESCAAEVISSV